MGEIMTNVNKWDNWYKDLATSPSSFRYGETLTYQLGAAFLSDCTTVEDWGTGAGGFKRFMPNCIGVDGSDTPHADKKFVDLVTYTTSCEGIYMRHVLEHNYDWEPILRNALTSASKKLCIILFTPLSETDTIELAHNLQHGVDVPDLSLGKKRFFDIVAEANPSTVRHNTLKTSTGYGEETVVYVEK